MAVTVAGPPMSSAYAIAGGPAGSPPRAADSQTRTLVSSAGSAECTPAAPKPVRTTVADANRNRNTAHAHAARLAKASKVSTEPPAREGFARSRPATRAGTRASVPTKQASLLSGPRSAARIAGHRPGGAQRMRTTMTTGALAMSSQGVPSGCRDPKDSTMPYAGSWERRRLPAWISYACWSRRSHP